MVIDCREPLTPRDPDCIECDPDYQYAKFTGPRWHYALALLAGLGIWALMLVGGYLFVAALIIGELSAVLAVFGIRP